MPKIDGFLNVRKPRDISSAGLVEKIRRLLAVPCGHAGTLDPMAEGVLVIGAGEARKFIRFLQDDKEYEGTMRLGQDSDTLDATGNLSAPRPVDVSEDRIMDAARKLQGEIELPVPAYSAVHVGGKRLYDLAREGKEVTPPIRRSSVYSLRVETMDLPNVGFTVACSAGTYIRSLAAEWGRMLGCGAHLTALIRRRSGRFLLADSHSLEEIDAMARDGGIAEVVIPARTCLAHLPEITAERAVALTGRSLAAPAGLDAEQGQAVRIIDAEGDLFGIGRATKGENGCIWIRPERMAAASRPES